LKRNALVVGAALSLIHKDIVLDALVYKGDDVYSAVGKEGIVIYSWPVVKLKVDSYY